jgi:hypothetical protein
VDLSAGGDSGNDEDHASGMSGVRCGQGESAGPNQLGGRYVGRRIYTFYGLFLGKTFRDITRDVHMFDPATRQWACIGSIPVAEGRLASSAVTIAGNIFLIGGYTVSSKGDEQSAPKVLAFDPRSHRFSRETSLPTPVDDTVGLPWRDRWMHRTVQARGRSGW